MIRLEHCSVQLGSTQALRDISMEIAPGEFVLLTGPSGCGKTTLAQTVCGLIPHAVPARIQGRVTVAGLDTQNHLLPELAQQVNIVFQNSSSQLFHLIVQDEVAFGPRNLGLPEAEITARVRWALEAVGLWERREHPVAELSGGQKQALAIAAVLALRPKVLVLDEPTASLDVPSSSRVVETLRTLRQEHGITILVIEHRFAAFVGETDRLLIMDAGKIIADGDPYAILRDSEIQRTLGLRRLGEQPLQIWPRLIHPNGQRQMDSPPLLSLENLSAGYSGRAVIHDVNLKIYPGDFIALVGDNGAGKSTLARVAAGLLKPLKGRVSFDSGSRPRPGLDVSLLFQDPTEQLFTDRVEEEVSFGPRNYGRFDESVSQEILREADLSALRDRKPFALSVGQQQRTALASCLALQPRLLILDEPTLGQDWGHLQQLMDYLIRLNHAGTAILLISHDYKLVHRYARRVLLMKTGHIAMRGKWSTMLENAKQTYRKESVDEIYHP